MNIFVLSESPSAAAVYHCDKHIPKMIVETAQMLSTAHRILDGELKTIFSSKGRKKKIWEHSDDQLEKFLYKATHYNHPCSVWARESIGNYDWLYKLFVALCNEYTHRYDKVHLTEKKLINILSKAPKNINRDLSITPFKRAMKSEPDCEKIPDIVDCYRAFYRTKKDRFSMTWTKRETPYWWKVW